MSSDFKYISEITIQGLLAFDPEEKLSKTGNTFLKLSVTVKPKQGTTDYYFVTVFDSELFESISELRKGDGVKVFGTFSVFSYTNKKGEPTIGLSIVASKLRGVQI